MDTIDVVFRLLQVGVIPILLLIWHELKDTRRSLEEYGRQIVRLEEQVKFAARVEERIMELEIWRGAHEGQLNLLIGEIRELQKRG